ncbi:MAG TPA: DNA gyrase inhibitor YacG [Bryobacteraceae bacterium]|jgi:endogenous inhibitor of DNA gyrase (YacG/DUF329 family)|nr:DNA gyrase inhibitor YacG [Bryobacteraceae bacterium]
MKCPICRKKVARESSDYPFCSERCRIIDLGNWATGKYVVSTPLSSTTQVEDNTREEDED